MAISQAQLDRARAKMNRQASALNKAAGRQIRAAGERKLASKKVAKQGKAGGGKSG